MTITSLSRRRLLQAATVGLGVLAFQTAFSLPVLADETTPPEPGSKEFVRYVMDRIDDLHRGESSHGVSKMEVKTAHFTRTVEMESWSKGKSYSLIRILSPKKERGTATLKARGDLFTYLNKTGRTIKITGGMLGASWMGSHFNNDDLVRDTRLADDFTIELTYSGEVASEQIHLFTLVPNPGVPVVWGKVEIVVRQSDLMPLRQAFYDEDGHRVRELAFADFKELSGRMMPTTMTMKPLDRPGEYTKISYASLDFDVELSDDFFTVQRLKSM